MTAYLLGHISDAHLPPMPKASVLELAGKRLSGYINWTRNRHLVHRREVLDELVLDLKAHRPDHIAVTGDLVNLALPDEFTNARDFLIELGTPQDVSLVPGNHDAYVRSTADLHLQMWGEYMCADGAKTPAFPWLRRRGPLALIGLSSALPTAPFMATGTLGSAQLDALDRMLASLQHEPAFRVLMVHHPLQSNASYKRLTDSAQLQEILKRHGVDLILHGHDHIHSLMHFEGPAGMIPAVGVPSASSLAHGERPGAAYNLFSISGQGTRWTCTQLVRGLKGQGTAIVEINRASLRDDQ